MRVILLVSFNYGEISNYRDSLRILINYYLKDLFYVVEYLKMVFNVLIIK